MSSYFFYKLGHTVNDSPLPSKSAANGLIEKYKYWSYIGARIMSIVLIKTHYVFLVRIKAMKGKWFEANLAVNGILLY